MRKLARVGSAHYYHNVISRTNNNIMYDIISCETKVKNGKEARKSSVVVVHCDHGIMTTEILSIWMQIREEMDSPGARRRRRAC